MVWRRAPHRHFAWLRPLGWLQAVVAVLCVTALSASSLHYVLIAHEHCEAHGELSHGDLGHADHDEHGSTASEVQVAENGFLLEQGEAQGDHEGHCDALGVVDSFAASVAPSAISDQLGFDRLDDEPTLPSWAIDNRRYRLAPKQSPPV